MVVAHQVGEPRVLTAVAPAGGGDGRAGRTAECERGAEEAGAAQESAPRHALGVENGGRDGRIGPGGQLLLGHGDPRAEGQWFMKEVSGS